MAQVTTTNAWIAANTWWITADHEPLVEQLRLLAQTMDTEMTERRRIASSNASAYRLTFQQLLAMKVADDSPQIPTATPVDIEDSLLGPAA